MNHRLIFCLLFFSVIIPGLICAQQTSTDASSYTSRIYKVGKKPETINDIAQKLKVDASLISTLNDALSIDSVLTKGQTIRVPVYYNDHAKHDKPAKNTQSKNEKPRKGKKLPIEVSDTTRTDSSLVTTTIKPSAPVVDTELIQNRILLTDATLDLNRALLQGVQVSLDTLDASDKQVVDPKNVQATLRNGQRQRDKVLLTPFLLHMQDSLKAEINNEEAEKASLENLLGINRPKPVTAARGAKKKYGTAIAVMDTTGAADAGDKHPKKTGKQNNPPKPPDNLDLSNANNQPVNVNPVNAGNPPVVRHWETAKAIYYNEDIAPEEPKVEDSVFADLPVAQEGQDTIAYIPGSDAGVDQAAVMSDSLRHLKAQVFITKAMKASNERNYRGAVSNLKKAIDLLPRFYEAWFALGEADAHLGLNTKALNEFKTCADIDSGKAVLYYKMGNIQLKLKQRAEAGASFEKALMLDSNYIPAIMGTASVDMEAKRYKAAIKGYTHALEIDWGYHTAYKSRAMAEYLLKSYAASVDDFTRYIIFDESDASVYFYRGMAKMKLDEKDDACADLAVAARLGYQPAFKQSEANCK